MSTIIETEIKQLCEIVNDQLGFTYGPEKKVLIYTRLEKRLKQLKLDLKAYLDLLKQEPREVEELLNLLTTNVTSFFREQQQLEIVKEKIFPELKRKNHKVYCWSAGCSSGEEPYTLAMMLTHGLNQGQKFSILGSDISAPKLKEAMAGVYSVGQLENVPPKYVKQHFIFDPQSDTYRISQELRQSTVFRRINLNEDFRIPNKIQFDLIFCRNVFIYLSKDSRERGLRRFYSILKPGGFLVLGTCENIDNSNGVPWRPLKNSIYQKELA